MVIYWISSENLTNNPSGNNIVNIMNDRIYRISESLVNKSSFLNNPTAK